MYEYIALFWLSANTYSSLLSSFLTIARQLHLHVTGEAKQELIASVLHWFNIHQGWLLIVDDVEDLEMVSAFLPTTSEGAILFTTRMQAIGTIAPCHHISPLSIEEGMHFLLRRANLLEDTGPLSHLTDAEITSARKVVELVDGIPLILDQLGAYIEETGCSIADCLKLYESQAVTLLNRRGKTLCNHSDSFASTVLCSLQHIERISPSALKLLYLCASLHSDAISESLLIEGASAFSPELGMLVQDRLQFDEALAILRDHSLLERNAHTRMLILRRPVRSVLQSYMAQKSGRSDCKTTPAK